MMRAISSATIQFGLISIPIKVYNTASPKQVGFNWLTPSGSRVKQKLVDDQGEEVQRADLLSGYEVDKGNFVSFSKDELNVIKKQKSDDDYIEITEAVGSWNVSPMAVEKTYFILPNKSDRAYRLLHSVLKSTNRFIVAKWCKAGKDNLVLIGPDDQFLMMYQLYYENELKKAEFVFGKNSEPSPQELSLAEQLINQISSDKFALEKYKDEYQSRLMEAIDQKMAGKTLVSENKSDGGAELFDLLDVLKKSLEKKAG